MAGFKGERPAEPDLIHFYGSQKTQDIKYKRTVFRCPLGKIFTFEGRLAEPKRHLTILQYGIIGILYEVINKPRYFVT